MFQSESIKHFKINIVRSWRNKWVEVFSGSKSNSRVPLYIASTTISPSFWPFSKSTKLLIDHGSIERIIVDKNSKRDEKIPSNFNRSNYRYKLLLHPFFLRIVPVIKSKLEDSQSQYRVYYLSEDSISSPGREEDREERSGRIFFEAV